MDSDSLLARLGVQQFKPLPVLRSGHAQTIASLFWPQLPDLKPESTHELALPDGDRIVLIENRPAGWKEGDRIAVLIHGLTGCHQSKYMIRLARKLTERGVLVIRINLRGCGPGFGLARKPYHSGRSEDTRAVLQWLERAHPRSPVTQIGFSLGANITLKMAGEDGAAPSGNLDSVVAVSPPIDLEACAWRITRPENRIYDRFFIRSLIQEIQRLAETLTDFEAPEFPEKLNLMIFDDLYTAPRSGFLSAVDYYRKSSSGPLISSIRVPTLILSSLDDPVIDAKAFDGLRREAGLPYLDLVLTRWGGHVGFIGLPSAGGHCEAKPWDFRWMDHLILRWLESVVTALPKEQAVVDTIAREK